MEPEILDILTEFSDAFVARVRELNDDNLNGSTDEERQVMQSRQQAAAERVSEWTPTIDDSVRAQLSEMGVSDAQINALVSQMAGVLPLYMASDRGDVNDINLQSRLSYVVGYFIKSVKTENQMTDAARDNFAADADANNVRRNQDETVARALDVSKKLNDTEPSDEDRALLAEYQIPTDRHNTVFGFARGDTIRDFGTSADNADTAAVNAKFTENLRANLDRIALASTMQKRVSKIMDNAELTDEQKKAAIQALSGDDIEPDKSGDIPDSVWDGAQTAEEIKQRAFEQFARGQDNQDNADNPDAVASADKNQSIWRDVWQTGAKSVGLGAGMTVLGTLGWTGMAGGTNVALIAGAATFLVSQTIHYQIWQRNLKKQSAAYKETADKVAAAYKKSADAQTEQKTKYDEIKTGIEQAKKDAADARKKIGEIKQSETADLEKLNAAKRALERQNKIFNQEIIDAEQKKLKEVESILTEAQKKLDAAEMTLGDDTRAYETARDKYADRMDEPGVAEYVGGLRNRVLEQKDYVRQQKQYVTRAGDFIQE
ncbi:MAG: hypothetical protein LBR41_01015, partial [Rickettsiales bacterium]|nr:hypothetical protein [Rickettsiales bacterium]